MFARLRTRLFFSYLVVAAAGVSAMFVVGVTITRTVYERRVGGFGVGRRQGRDVPVTESQLRTALDESLVPALLAGVGAALAAAALVAIVISRRVLRPVDDMQRATRRMLTGHYDVRVLEPDVVELAALARDVNTLGGHLAEIEQRRTRLLAEVTHELRTPLTVIRGHAEAMLDGLAVPTEATYVAIGDEAARMQRLVDDLSTLSRADEGTLELVLADVDLAEAVITTAERLRPQFDDARVALVAEPRDPGDPLVVRGDRDRLTQIFSNLLGNALVHTPAGGTVTVRSGRADSTAWIDIVDTGEGIDAADLDLIFDRFYRAPDRASGDPSRRAGRGLGLTISRSLAYAHGGDLTATSRGLGCGASFRVSVPTATDTTVTNTREKR